uniref:Inhibitor_I29 domain-containing protein n=1 Tax=Heterorhabditis bacteriophora TaxID=37862 RepID=A0A1I7X0P6_HETBA
MNATAGTDLTWSRTIEQSTPPAPWTHRGFCKVKLSIAFLLLCAPGDVQWDCVVVAQASHPPSVYDLGGHERIRDIWTNYYAEVSKTEHKDTAKKPFLVILNNKTNGEMDDFDFSNSLIHYNDLDTSRYRMKMNRIHQGLKRNEAIKLHSLP